MTFLPFYLFTGRREHADTKSIVFSFALVGERQTACYVTFLQWHLMARNLSYDGLSV